MEGEGGEKKFRNFYILNSENFRLRMRTHKREKKRNLLSPWKLYQKKYIFLINGRIFYCKRREKKERKFLVSQFLPSPSSLYFCFETKKHEKPQNTCLKVGSIS